MAGLIAAVTMLVIFGSPNGLAVWPPSTAFQDQPLSILYGIVVIALVVGIVLGVWAQRSRHEHK